MSKASWRSSAGTILSLLFFLGLVCSLTGLASAQPTTCPTDMEAYWKLDELTGSTSFVDSAGDNDGACQESGSPLCPQVEAEGKINGAWTFSRAASTGIDVPGAAFNWDQDDSFSVEFWMKSTPGAACLNAEVSSNEVLVGRVGSSFVWWAGILCANNPQGVATFFLFSGGNSVVLKGSSVVTDGKWHHIAAVREGSGTNILYVDGRQEDTDSGVSFPGGFSDASAPLHLGWLNIDEGFHFSGVLDEVAIHNAALAANEVSAHYYLARDYCVDCSTVPVRIMPLGDSITEGSASGAVPDEIGYWTSYRKDLYVDLTAQGFNVDFVGSLPAGGTVGGFDTDQEGHNGSETADILVGLQGPDGGWLAADPEVILLHIGTNDISQTTDADTVVNGVKAILDRIHEIDPDATVVLARIINRVCDGDCPKVALTTVFNNKLQFMADGLIAEGRKIIVVNQEAALDYRLVGAGGDMYDELHPYADGAGYGKMADVWLSALQDILPYCSPAAPSITSTPVTKGFVGVPYSYTVKATGSPAPLFRLEEKPGDMVINAVTGVISGWTPSAEGPFTVRVVADNGVDPDAEQEFTIVVGADPHCPADTISLWSMDALQGSTLPDFFGVNDGSCIGDCPSAATGQVSGAMQFNGSTTGVNVPAHSSFNWAADGSFTIEYWMKKSTACTGNEVVMGRTDPGRGLFWWTGCWGDDNTAAFMLLGGNGVNTVKGTTPLTDGEWHHIAVVRDGSLGQSRLYVDGFLEGTANSDYTNDFSSLTAPLNIGWFNLDPFFHYNGMVDELAVYGRALPESAILVHYLLGQTHAGYCHAESAPVIVEQPKNVTVVQGQSATFTVVVASESTPSYQWWKGTESISGATNASYTIASAQAGDAGSYKCVVTNGVGSTESNAATLTVNVPASVATHPESATRNQGQSVTFSVVAAGTAPFTYQWQKNGVAIGGATDSSYTIASVVKGDEGSYTCVVTNMAGNATSNAATLTVIVPPSITTQPESQPVNLGDAVSFTVEVDGTAPFNYQWKKDGVDIPGATSSSYAIASVAAGDIGSYTVVVSNPAGTVTSNAATLTVCVPPAITTHPESQTKNRGESVTFSVAASGTSPSYQWKKNGVDIPGATSSSYAIASVEAGDIGSYTCVVSNPAGTVTSNAATLTVQDPDIEILSQPVGAALVEGYNAKFRIRAKGPKGAKLTYQWEKDGVDIAGATRSNYATPPLTALADDGSVYRCRITNSLTGLWRYTDPATVSVTQFLITGQPASVIIKQGQTARFKVKAKGPKGAKLSYQWQQWNDAQSRWENIELATRNSLSRSKVTGDLNGAQFRCQISASNGAGPVETDVATLTVTQ